MIAKPPNTHGRNEAIMWTLALVVLAILPVGTNEHVTFCIPRLLGFHECLGCGIGESIGCCLRGDLRAAMHAHVLGPFATLVILGRIATLTIQSNHFIQR